MPTTVSSLHRYPYNLTLTVADRNAIDWIGDRYAHGEDMRALLMGCQVLVSNGIVDNFDESVDANGLAKGDIVWETKENPHPITFHLQEHEAWIFQSLCEQSELRFDCFAEELKAKFLEVYNKIV